MLLMHLCCGSMSGPLFLLHLACNSVPTHIGCSTKHAVSHPISISFKYQTHCVLHRWHSSSPLQSGQTMTPKPVRLCLLIGIVLSSGSRDRVHHEPSRCECSCSRSLLHSPSNRSSLESSHAGTPTHRRQHPPNTTHPHPLPICSSQRSNGSSTTAPNPSTPAAPAQPNSNSNGASNGNGATTVTPASPVVASTDAPAGSMAAAKAAFLAQWKDEYGYGGRIDQLYRDEVGCRMKPNEHYLDYTGSALYCSSALNCIFEDLQVGLRSLLLLALPLLAC